MEIVEMLDNEEGARRLVDDCIETRNNVVYPTLPEIRTYELMQKIVEWVSSGQEVPKPLILKKNFGQTTVEELE